jgi:hypothetical protein
VQGAQPGEIFLGAEQFLDAGGMAQPEQRALAHDIAVGRRQQSGEHPQQAGLAAAVGATDPQHIAGAQVQVESLEQQPAVALAAQAMRLQVRGHEMGLGPKR